MLDTNDIQVLREMFMESEIRMTGKIVESETRMTGKIVESETRMTEKMDALKGWMETLLHKELNAMRDDIIEVINDGVLPQINSLSIRITRLERMQRQAAY